MYTTSRKCSKAHATIASELLDPALVVRRPCSHVHGLAWASTYLRLLNCARGGGGDDGGSDGAAATVATLTELPLGLFQICLQPGHLHRSGEASEVGGGLLNHART